MDEALSCSICMDLFKDPVQLHCLHSLCQGCFDLLQRSAVRTVLPCPECREIIEEGQVKKNIQLGLMVDLYREITASEDLNIHEQYNPHFEQYKRLHQQVTNVLDTKRRLGLQMQHLTQVHQHKQIQLEHLHKKLEGLLLQNYKKRQSLEKHIQAKDSQYEELQKQLNHLDDTTQHLNDFEKTMKIHEELLKQRYGTQLKTLEEELKQQEPKPREQPVRPQPVRPQPVRPQHVQKHLREKQFKHLQDKLKHRYPGQREQLQLTRSQIQEQIQQVLQTQQQSQVQNETMWKQLHHLQQKHEKVRIGYQEQLQEQTQSEEQGTGEIQEKLKHHTESEQRRLQFEEKLRQYETQYKNIQDIKIRELNLKLEKVN